MARVFKGFSDSCDTGFNEIHPEKENKNAMINIPRESISGLCIATVLFDPNAAGWDTGLLSQSVLKS